MLKTSFCALMAALVLPAFANASESIPLTITPIFTQAKTLLPLIGITGERLVFSENQGKKVHVVDLGSLAESGTFDSGTFSSDLAVDPASGWVALCTQTGTKLIVFRASRPNEQFTLDFQNSEDLACAGVSIETKADGDPMVWLGDMGDQRVVLIDPISGRAEKIFKGISGPSHLIHVGGMIFSINDTVYPNFGIPYIFEASSGASIVGDALGQAQKTSMTRGYSSQIFYDAKSEQVLYLRHKEHEMHAFSASHPSEQTIRKISLLAQSPKAVARYGNCLAVLGHTDDAQRRPQWEVLDQNFKSIRLTDFQSDASIFGATRMLVHGQGDLVISHWKGVSLVRGLFEGLNCTN